MIALISLLVVILFSIIVIRIGTVALEMTGLSKEMAAFQAQSAFSEQALQLQNQNMLFLIL